MLLSHILTGYQHIKVFNAADNEQWASAFIWKITKFSLNKLVHLNIIVSTCKTQINSALSARSWRIRRLHICIGVKPHSHSWVAICVAWGHNPGAWTGCNLATTVVTWPTILHLGPYWARQAVGGANQSAGHVKPEYLYYLPTPPLGQDMTQGQFLSWV